MVNCLYQKKLNLVRVSSPFPCLGISAINDLTLSKTRHYPLFPISSRTIPDPNFRLGLSLSIREFHRQMHIVSNLTTTKTGKVRSVTINVVERILKSDLFSPP